MTNQDSNGEIIIYQSEDGTSKLDVKLEDETVWLTQAQLVDLFQSSKANVSEHIKNIYNERELEESSTVREFRIVRREGSRDVTRNIKHYNLDMIISLGYRIQSKVATHFRRWATDRLKEIRKRHVNLMTIEDWEGLITLYTPSLEDLWFKQEMLADPETMSYNHAWGGTISFPKEKWRGWYDFWIVNHANKRYYRYLKDNTGRFIGEIAYHYDANRKLYMANVIVHAPYRGKGYGSVGLERLCDAAKKNGVDVLYDDIAIDNPAITIFLKHGFIEEYRTEQIIMLRKEL